MLLPDETKPPAVLMKLISQDTDVAKIRDDYVQNINAHKITMAWFAMAWFEVKKPFIICCFNCKSTGKKTPHEFCDPPFLFLFTLPNSAHSAPGRKFRELENGSRKSVAYRNVFERAMSGWVVRRINECVVERPMKWYERNHAQVTERINEPMNR